MKRNQIPKFYTADSFENINDFNVSQNLVREKFNVHQHEYFELEYIIEGEGVSNLNGERERVKKGDVVFITPMDSHGFEECLIRTITIHFSADYLNPVLKSSLLSGKNRVIEAVSSVAHTYFELSHRIFNQENEKYKEIKIKNLVELILLEIMPDIFSVSQRSVYTNDRLSDAIGYINTNFTKEITLCTIEKMFCLSPSYFSHAFKERVGKTFVSYICEKRIDYAKKLLLSGVRVIDACYECGFTSERNFSRRFKQITGITPSEFAKKSK